MALRGVGREASGNSCPPAGPGKPSASCSSAESSFARSVRAFGRTPVFDGLWGVRKNARLRRAMATKQSERTQGPRRSGWIMRFEAARSRMTSPGPTQCIMLSRVVAGGSTGAVRSGRRRARRLLALWHYLLVDRFAVRFHRNPCHGHGRACPGHPRRAAARTSPASARPAEQEGGRSQGFSRAACEMRWAFVAGQDQGPAMTP